MMVGAYAPLASGPPMHRATNAVDSCVRCGFAGGDVRIHGCGCTLHTRCVGLSDNGEPMNFCPHCGAPSGGMSLIPMSFRELDEAKKTAHAVANHAAGNQRKKRKVPGEVTGLDEKNSNEESDQRTGRWTPAETAYVDELIAKFEGGTIPIVDGIKLNDFLATMLQCKQSRLTKKMKNAKLSSRSFKRTTGYIADINDAREFSGLEEAFFHSIHRVEERAEMRFHMQKQWREMFSSYCAGIGHALDSDAWLNSVEEIERRAAMARDAARLIKRKQMIGKALQRDSKNPDIGVVIDESDDTLGSPVEDFSNEYSQVFDNLQSGDHDIFNGSSGGKTYSPYLEKIIKYLERGNVPFEHVDAWVPSFVPVSNADYGSSGSSKCRLCFAGCVTADVQSPKRREQISNEEHFNLVTFGEYSRKFQFDIGCGLPGRVYQSGIPTWEQSVHNAPLEHFERCGGAIQCGIRTVVGIPIPSPNVGRIVVILYSCHDRQKDQELVSRLTEEFTRLMPSPRWQLIVDIGATADLLPMQAVTSSSSTVQQSVPQSHDSDLTTKDPRIDAVVTLLGEHMPSDPSSPLATYLPGFMSLRLLILRPSRSEHEEELVRTMLDSYESYTSAGRSPSDIAVLLARDCMFLTQQPFAQQPVPVMSQSSSMVGTSTSNYNPPSNQSTPSFAPIGHNMKQSSGSTYAHQVTQAQSSNSISGNQGVWNHNFVPTMPMHVHAPVGHPPPLSLPQQQHYQQASMVSTESLTRGNGVGEMSSEILKSSLSSQPFHSPHHSSS